MYTQQGNGTASKKASAKVGLGFKSQEKVLALVQQQVRDARLVFWGFDCRFICCHTCVPWSTIWTDCSRLMSQQTTSRGPAAQMLDMDSRKLEKRLAGMYEKLTDAGFSDSQVGFRTCTSKALATSFISRS